MYCAAITTYQNLQFFIPTKWMILSECRGRCSLQVCNNLKIANFVAINVLQLLQIHSEIRTDTITRAKIAHHSHLTNRNGPGNTTTYTLLYTHSGIGLLFVIRHYLCGPIWMGIHSYDFRIKLYLTCANVQLRGTVLHMRIVSSHTHTNADSIVCAMKLF